MTSDEEDDQLLQRVASHAAQLAEHFDSVQILCTKNHNDGTTSFKKGEGCIYSRLANAREFVDEDKIRNFKRLTSAD